MRAAYCTLMLVYALFSSYRRCRRSLSFASTTSSRTSLGRPAHLPNCSAHGLKP